MTPALLWLREDCCGDEVRLVYTVSYKLTLAAEGDPLSARWGKADSSVGKVLAVESQGGPAADPQNHGTSQAWWCATNPSAGRAGTGEFLGLPGQPTTVAYLVSSRPVADLVSEEKEDAP